MKFNEQQLKIVNHINGPLLCIAGPGSGKTTSIIGRVLNMVKNGVDAQSILVVTFTKAAADEMEKRYLNMPDAKEGPTFSTIHSICYKILRTQFPKRYTKDSVITDFDQRNFIREKIQFMHLEKTDQDFIVNNLLGAISCIKNNNISPFDIEIDGCTSEQINEIYKSYEEYKAENGVIDFDDMLCLTNQLFESDKTALAFWRKKFNYIIVDEFQDTNKLQAKILYDIASPKNNICIVGDDDQSIYRFRGAVPKVMLDFEKAFKGCTKVILDTNYRSKQNIVAQTKQLIENNKTRFEKSLNAYKKEDGIITYDVYKNRDREISQIIKSIKTKQRKEEPLEEIAILYRMNNQAQQVAQMLTKADIPFYTNEPIYHIYEHWVFRDILNFRRVAEEKCSVLQFLSVVNRPNKYISRKILPSTYSEKGVMDATLKITEGWKQKKMKEALEDFYFWIHKMKTMTPSQFIKCMRTQLEYDKFIKTYAENNRLDESQFTDVINEIEDISKSFNDFNEWISFTEKEIYEFKQKIKNKKKEGSVSLSTMHKAKGLEWDEVYIIDANEEITPHVKANDTEEMEEERRMFYVAATRARDILHICSIEKRNKSPMYPSRFIKEMQIKNQPTVQATPVNTVSAQTEELKPQTWVFHKTFGSGVITKVDSNTVTVAFANVGLKSLDKDWCAENLEIFNH